jgi:hypothetical protein
MIFAALGGGLAFGSRLHVKAPHILRGFRVLYQRIGQLISQRISQRIGQV